MWLIAKLQNSSDNPTICVSKHDSEWEDAFKKWLNGENPTDSTEWKKGVIGCTENVMQYDQALQEANKVGSVHVSHASHALLAQTIKSVAFLHAVNPEKTYIGAVILGKTAKDIAELSVSNPTGLGELSGLA